MAMFDWYEPGLEAECPRCGGAVRDWQGYDGVCALVVWRQGSAAPVDQPIDEEWRVSAEKLATLRLPGRFSMYGWCGCGGGVEAEGECEGGAWVRSRVVEGRG
jgi:hypothetical protein